MKHLEPKTKHKPVYRLLIHNNKLGHPHKVELRDVANGITLEKCYSYNANKLNQFNLSQRTRKKLNRYIHQVKKFWRYRRQNKCKHPVFFNSVFSSTCEFCYLEIEVIPDMDELSGEPKCWFCNEHQEGMLVWDRSGRTGGFDVCPDCAEEFEEINEEETS